MTFRYMKLLQSYRKVSWLVYTLCLDRSRDSSSAVTAQASGGGFSTGLAAHPAQQRPQGNKSSLSLACCCLLHGFTGRIG